MPNKELRSAGGDMLEGQPVDLTSLDPGSPRPFGTNPGSLGIWGFVCALAVASVWLGLSLWLALPWMGELAGRVGWVPAGLIIGGIALAPGFMNAFQTTSLLLRPAGHYRQPMHYPALTILIAAYNEAGHIASTLRSLRAQRYPAPIHVIVIDDGSRDSTPVIVRELFPETEIIQLAKNGGKAAALNRGLAVAPDALVVTLDADSWLHADALRYLVLEYINGQPNTAAVAGAVFVGNGENTWSARLQYWDYLHGIAATKRAQAAYGGTLVAQGALSLYRTDLLRELGGWPQSIGEDIVVTWAMLSRGYDVGYAERALCFTNVPETFGGLVRQRARWARGMIEAFRHHPDILRRRRITTFLVGWNLLFPWQDLVFTIAFVPGLILALFGQYWLVGPFTLTLLPSAAFIGFVMYRTTAKVFRQLGFKIAWDPLALVAYTLAYGLVNHPASLRGYMAELFGREKTWGTK
ncbi:MAG TPA: glycosyltransferase [Paraburkholderia sp.]